MSQVSLSEHNQWKEICFLISMVYVPHLSKLIRSFIDNMMNRNNVIQGMCLMLRKEELQLGRFMTHRLHESVIRKTWLLWTSYLELSKSINDLTLALIAVSKHICTIIETYEDRRETRFYQRNIDIEEIYEHRRERRSYQRNTDIEEINDLKDRVTQFKQWRDELRIHISELGRYLNTLQNARTTSDIEISNSAVSNN